MRDSFRQAGVGTPERDARLLAETAFGLDRLALVNREREPGEAAALERLGALAARRLAGEPVARILGAADFFGRTFRLGEATLVPRPETELLVARALRLLDGRACPRVLDLGTGTGCIGISILAEMPTAQVMATDISPQAIEMARANAEAHGVAGRFEVRLGSWYEPLAEDARFDLIVSNPPYIETAVIPTLAVEVRAHDPHRALDGGADGLAAYRVIVAGAGTRLKPGAALAVEIGWDQGAAVTELFAAGGLVEVVCEQDLAGHDRIVIGRRG